MYWEGGVGGWVGVHVSVVVKWERLSNTHQYARDQERRKIFGQLCRHSRSRRTPPDYSTEVE